MEGEAKKRVKHPDAEDGRLTKTIKFRVRGDTYETFKLAAYTAGRSISEEAEHRLLHSFAADDLRLIVQQEVFSAVRDALAVALASRSDIPGERTEDEPSQRPQ